MQNRHSGARVDDRLELFEQARHAWLGGVLRGREGLLASLGDEDVELTEDVPHLLDPHVFVRLTADSGLSCGCFAGRLISGETHAAPHRDARAANH